MFYNIRNSIDKRLARTIYYGCIYSKISYGIEIYGSASNSKLQRIQTLQNKLMKLLNKRDYLYSTNQLHIDMNTLKVTDIYRFKISQFVYNCLSGNQICNFSNYFTVRGNYHHRNLRNINQLHTPTIRTELGRTTVQNTGATLWNNISDNIKAVKSIHIFKKLQFKSIISEYTIQYSKI